MEVALAVLTKLWSLCRYTQVTARLRGEQDAVATAAVQTQIQTNLSEQ